MNLASRTLLALAAIAPMVSALDVKDDDLKLGLKLHLQVRAQKAWAQDRDGNQYDVTNGTAAEPDDLDFSVRRARIGFAGVYKDVYKFAYVLRNDDQDKSAAAVTASNRMPQTHVAYIERVFKNEEAGSEQSIRAGLDYAFFNGTSAVFGSSSLFPSDRATVQAPMLAPRGVGVGYKYSTSRMTAGFDIQNNSTTANAANDPITINAAGDSASGTDNGVTDGGEGMFYGFRIQGILFDNQAKPHMKPVESFIGAEGTGLFMSFEAGINRDDNISPTSTVNTKAIGIEALFHHNALTVLAEFRRAQAEVMDSAAVDYEQDRLIYLIQAGYAMPLGDKVIEPAIRLTRIDLNDDLTEASNYGSNSDYGSSGYQTELGVNYYINKNANKMQLGYQYWRGEGGGPTSAGDAKASIVRLQWQLVF